MEVTVATAEAVCGPAVVCAFTGCADVDVGLVTTIFTGSLTVDGTVLVKVTDPLMQQMHKTPIMADMFLPKVV